MQFDTEHLFSDMSVNRLNSTKTAWTIIARRIQQYGIEKIVIPEGVLRIFKGAFKGIFAISEVVLPKSLLVIEDEAFSDCPRLETIEIPDNVTSIGEKAFKKNYALTNVKFGKEVQELGSEAFRETNIEHLVFPPKLGICHSFTFADCKNLKTVVFNENMNEICHCAFAECRNLQSVEFPSSHFNIGCQAFLNCRNLKHVNLELTCSIGDAAFLGCGLEYIVIPESPLCHVLQNAFAKSNAATLVIKNPFPSIDDDAFYDASIETVVMFVDKEYGKMDIIEECKYCWGFKPSRVCFITPFDDSNFVIEFDTKEK